MRTLWGLVSLRYAAISPKSGSSGAWGTTSEAKAVVMVGEIW